ncbi:MAG: protein kinase [Thermoanaerobacterales bacterium]|nr:protein kinase [Thermoanaerobacterales bacterium]
MRVSMDLNDFFNNLDILSKGSSYKPHKYLLLLAVLDMFQIAKTPENKIYFDDRLKSHYSRYFKNYKCKDDRNRPHTPFFHLRSSGFWYLKAKPGRESVCEKLSSVGGPGDIINNFEYACLSEPVFKLFTNRESATKIKNYILSKLEKRTGPETFREERETYSTTGLGKSLFKHEEEAIKVINSAVSSIGKILSNVYLYDKQSNNYYEYDIILVAHSGIYVIELKHWSGHIRVEPYNWIINNTQTRTDPHKNNGFKCKVLKGIYQHNFKTYPNVWVKSVVVLTNPDSNVDGASSPRIAAEQDINNPTFASIQDLITYLKKKETLLQEQFLNDQQISSIISYLTNLNTPRQMVKYAVPGYETVEYLSQKPECIELIARPMDGRAKGLNRFRIFRTPLYTTAIQKKRFMKRAYNTLKTVSEIGDHPHIQKVWVFENDNGDIIEGSDWSETGTLNDYIHQKERSISIEDAFRICRGILLGLNTAHQLGVIHRAVKPENILMFNGIPKLINFDLAYQVEDNRITVIPDASQLKDDGYTAPEVIHGEDIDESTDFFSVGVIAFEMLARDKPFKTVREFITKGGHFNECMQQKLEQAGVPEKSIEVIKGLLVADRAKRLKDVEKIIAAFDIETEESRRTTETLAVNARLEPGDKYDVYEIIEQIGQGREAQIYKAKTLGGRHVVIKLFNSEVPQERILREGEITSAINSSYVVKCNNKIGHWKGERFFLELDYVEGNSLREKIDSKEKPDIETFRSVAFCVMEAIRSFHEHQDEEGNPKPYLHSDVKPDNVIITPKPDNKAVLIDFGIAGEPRVDVFQGTNGYVPPDSIRGTDMEFSVSGDIFALGVTLWEWLFGEKPYKAPAVGDVPCLPEELSDEVKIYIPWLMKAVATEADKRFASIQEMQNAFIECSISEESAAQPDIVEVDEVAIQERDTKTVKIVSEDEFEKGNPFVKYLNSLSEASAGNENATAESQLTSDYFDRILVTNPLTDYVFEKLVNDKINVILTGNAGDGKTTIAAEIYQRVTGHHPQILHPITHAGDIIIVKDMSELRHHDQRTDIIKDALNNSSNRYLIVSNTGALLECFRDLKNKNDIKADVSELLNALEADEPQNILNDKFMLINIANMDSIDTASQVFKRMLETDNWLACQKCKFDEKCPIFRNVRLLQDELQTVTERVMLLYKRLYEYDVRLTMRQMTGHLAYAITAGKNCADIHAMSIIALQNTFNRFLFFNRFFGDDGSEVAPEALQLLPVRKIQETEFGIHLDPYFERKAWAKDNTKLPLTGEALRVGHTLLKSKNQNDPSIRRQVRRLVYFFGSLDDETGKRYLSTFLRTPMLIKYIEYSQGRTLDRMTEEKYRHQILHVLQEYFTGVRLPEETWQVKDLYITLRPYENSTGTQMVLASFREEDFELTLKDRFRVGKNDSKVLALCLKDSDIEMKLELPFLDFIARRYQGNVAEELSAYYANRLEQFKVKLLAASEQKDGYLTLLRIRYGGSFDVIKIHVSDDSLEVFS